MNCVSVKAPNGADSILYAALTPRIGSDAAVRMTHYTRTQAFKNLYGEYFEGEFIAGSKNATAYPLDVNGEPSVDWLQTQIITEGTTFNFPAPGKKPTVKGNLLTRAMATEDTDMRPESVVKRWFISGGKLSREAMLEKFGKGQVGLNTGKRQKQPTEITSKKKLWSKDAKGSVTAIAEDLHQAQITKLYELDEFRNAVEEVIAMYDDATQMAQSIVDELDALEAQQQAYEAPNERQGETIFVFPSSLSGAHTFGSALLASQMYGAVTGEGKGRTGQAYAIPTRLSDKVGLSLAEVTRHIEEFIEYAEANPDLTLDMRQAETLFGGFRLSQIAPLFAGVPMNVLLPAQFDDYNLAVYEAAQAAATDTVADPVLDVALPTINEQYISPSLELGWTAPVTITIDLEFQTGNAMQIEPIVATSMRKAMGMIKAMFFGDLIALEAIKTGIDITMQIENIASINGMTTDQWDAAEQGIMNMVTERMITQNLLTGVLLNTGNNLIKAIDEAGNEHEEYAAALMTVRQKLQTESGDAPARIDTIDVPWGQLYLDMLIPMPRQLRAKMGSDYVTYAFQDQALRAMLHMSQQIITSSTFNADSKTAKESFIQTLRAKLFAHRDQLAKRGETSIQLESMQLMLEPSVLRHLETRLLKLLAEDFKTGFNKDGEMMFGEFTGKLDWSDAAESYNVMGSASTQMKLFLASIPMQRLVNEEEQGTPKDIKLFVKDSLRDRLLSTDKKVMKEKKYTVRTKEQLDKLKMSADQPATFKVSKRMVVKDPTTNRESNQLVEGVFVLKPMGRYDKTKNKDFGGVLAEEGIKEDDAYAIFEILPVNTYMAETINAINDFGLPYTQNYRGLFQEILSLLSDQPGNFNQFISTMQTSENPNIVAAANALQNRATERVKREFTVLMRAQSQNFTVLLIDPIKNIYITKDASEGSVIGNIIESWKQAQKKSDVAIVRDNQLVLDRERLSYFAAKISDLNKMDWKNSDVVDQSLTLARDILRAHGIKFNLKMVEDLYENINKWSKRGGGWPAQFAITKEGAPTGIFSGLVFEDSSTIANDEEQDAWITNNALYTKPKVIRTLARIYAKYANKEFNRSHKNVNGDTVWPHNLNHNLSRTVARFQELDDNTDFREELFTSAFSRNNYLLDRTATGEATMFDLARNIELRYMDGQDVLNSTRDGKRRTRMADVEQDVFALSLFVNNGDSRLSSFIGMTHADKTTTPIYDNVPRVKVVNTISNHMGIPVDVITAQAQEAGWKLFKAEFERMHESSDVYDRAFNGNYFYVSPFFNKQALKAYVTSGVITQAEYNLLWNNQTDFPETSTADQQLEAMVKKVWRSEFKSMAERQMQIWLKHGVVYQEGMEYKMRVNQKHFANTAVESQVNVFGGMYTFQTEVAHQLMLATKEAEIVAEGMENTTAQEEINLDQSLRVAMNIATEFAVNGFLFNAATVQLFLGDPAQSAIAAEKAAKMDEATFIRRTLIAFQKRLTKNIAPGKEPAWAPDDTHYHTITLVDPKLNDLARHIAGSKYTNYDTAVDGFEITTMREKINLMYATAKIDADAYTEMLAIITEGEKREDGWYEFTKPRHIAAAFSIDKPVYVGTRLSGRTRMFDYVKSSAMALYPPAVAGTELNKLRLKMEARGDLKKQTARAHFNTTKKLGAPGVQGNWMNSKQEIEFDKTWDQARQVAQRKYLMIQQEVPYDEEKNHIKMMSQTNTLITMGIMIMSGFKTPTGDEYNGAGIISAKQEIINRLLELNAEEYLKNVTTAIKTSLGDTFNEVDLTKIYRKLYEDALTSPGNKYSPAELASLKMLSSKAEGYNVPLILNPNYKALQSLVMSGINSAMKLKLPGKSFVQASGAGFKRSFGSLSNSEKAGIIWAREDVSTLEMMQVGETESIAAQVLLPFNYHVDGKKLKAKDFTVEVNGRMMIDPTRLPEALRKMVVARIPTQAHNSMLLIEVVGFIPDEMGDTIIVPPGITVQMGSDFDVDKLYGYFYNYKLVNGVITRNEDTERFRLENKYLDLHIAVLSHKGMIKEILAPLDIDDMTDQSAAVKPDVQGTFFETQFQLRDHAKQRIAKELVGLAALMNTFHATTEDLNLRYEAKEYVELETLIGERYEELLLEGVDEATASEQAYTELTREYRETNTKRAVPVPVHMSVTIIKGKPLSRVSGHGTTTVIVNPKTNETVTRTKHENISQYLSGVVDYANKRGIDGLNIDVFTHKALAALLLMQGDTDKESIMDWEEIAMFLRQPALVELADKLRNSSVFDSEYVNEEQAIKDFIAEWEEGLTMIETIDTRKYKPKDAFTVKELARMLDTNINTTDGQWHSNQLTLLKKFKELWDIGNRIVELQSLFNHNVKGVENDIIQAHFKFNSINSLVNTEEAKRPMLRGAAELISKERGTFSYQYQKVFTQTAAKLLPLKGITTLLEYVAKISGVPLYEISEKRVDEFLNYLRGYAMSRPSELIEDAEQERYRLLLVQNSIAVRVAEMQQLYPANVFLQRLNKKYRTELDKPDLINYLAFLGENADADAVYESFVQILKSSDKQLAMLGRDLVIYNIVTSSSQSWNNFHRFVSPYILRSGGIAKNMTDMVEMLGDKNIKPERLISKFSQALRNYYQHVPNRSRNIKPESGRKGARYIVESGTMYQDAPEEFTFPHPGAEGAHKKLMSYWTGTLKEGNYPAYMHTYNKAGRPVLYERTGDGRRYIRIPTLGGIRDKMAFDENGSQKSMLPANNPAVYFPPIVLPHPSESQTEDAAENSIVKWFEELPQRRDVDAKEGLEVLIKDKSQSDLHRNLAQMLGDVANTLSQQLLRAPNINVRGLTTTTNQYIPFSESGSVINRVKLQRLQGPKLKGREAEILLHELSHAAVSPVIALVGDLAHLSIEQIMLAYPGIDESMLRKLRGDTGILQAIKNLRNIMAQVENTPGMVDKYGGEGAFINLHEFVVRAQTNAAFMIDLNNIQVNNRSVLAMIADWFNDILSAIAKALGINIQKGSALEQTLMNVTRLMTNNIVLDNRVSYTYQGAEVLVHLNEVGMAYNVTQLDGSVLSPYTTDLKRQSTIEDIIKEYSGDNDTDISGLLNPPVIYEFSQTYLDGNTEGPWQVTNEKDRITIANRAKLAGMSTNIDANGMMTFNFDDDLNDTDMELGNSVPLQALINELVTVRGNLRKTMNSVTPVRERAARAAAEAMMTRNIQKLRNEMRMDTIPVVMEENIKWAENVFKNLSASQADLVIAYKLMRAWSGMVKIMYAKFQGQVVQDDEIDKMKGEADTLADNIYRARIKQALDKEAETSSGRGLTTGDNGDFDGKLVKTSKFSDMLLAMSRSNNQVAQQGAVWITEQVRFENEAIWQHNAWLADFESKIKAYGGTAAVMSKILRQGQRLKGRKTTVDWGVVTPFTQLWNDRNFEAWKKMKDELPRWQGMVGWTQDEINAQTIATVQRYWDFVSNETVFADFRVLFEIDVNTGEVIDNTGPEYAVEIARLEAAVGDSQEVAEMVAKSKAKYQQYHDNMEGAVDLLLQNLGTGMITQTEFDEEKRLYELTHDPTLFLEAIDNKTVLPDNLESNKYLVFAPTATSSQRDPAYTAVREDAKLKEIYDMYREKIEAFKKMLPYTVQDKLDDSFLPTIMQELIKDKTSFGETMRGLGKSIREGMGFSQRIMDTFGDEKISDPENAGVGNIPLRFVGEQNPRFFRSTDMEAAATKDIVRIMEMFGGMAIHQKYMSRIKAKLDMVQIALDNMAVEGGQSINSLMESWKYLIDTVVHEKPKLQEFTSDGKLRSANPVKNLKLANKLKQLQADKVDAGKRYAADENVNDDGTLKYTEIEYFEDIERINKEMDKINESNKGVFFVGSKLGDALIHITQRKALSFNPLSGLANVTFGMISSFIHAAGGEDFTKKELRRASGVVAHSTKQWLGHHFGLGASKTSRKILALMVRTNSMNELMTTHFGESNLLSNKDWWKKVPVLSSPYEFMRAGDYYVRATNMVAMMLHTKIKTAAGEEITLWDAMDETGQIADTHGEIEEWSMKDMDLNTRWIKFINKVGRVHKITLGNTDRATPVYVSKHIIGRLVTQFRRVWMFEGFANRFESKHYDRILERDVKGRYVTAKDVGLFTTLVKSAQQLIMDAVPFMKGDVLGSMRIAGVPITDVGMETDAANMRKNIQGFKATVYTLLTIMVWKKLMADDDEEKDAMDGMMMLGLNLLNRQYQDLTFYSTTDAPDNLIRKIIPATSVIGDIGKFISATKKVLLDEDYTKEEWFLKFTKMGIPFPESAMINRFKFQMERDASMLHF